MNLQGKCSNCASILPNVKRKLKATWKLLQFYDEIFSLSIKFITRISSNSWRNLFLGFPGAVEEIFQHLWVHAFSSALEKLTKQNFLISYQHLLALSQHETLIDLFQRRSRSENFTIKEAWMSPFDFSLNQPFELWESSRRKLKRMKLLFVALLAASCICKILRFPWIISATNCFLLWSFKQCHRRAKLIVWSQRGGAQSFVGSFCLGDIDNRLWDCRLAC